MTLNQLKWMKELGTEASEATATPPSPWVGEFFYFFFGTTSHD
jgi:hypothetical protein